MGDRRKDYMVKGNDEVKLLSVSHYNRNGSAASRLDCGCENMEEIMNVYDWGSRRMLAMLDKEASYDELMEWYLGVAGCIGDGLSLDINVMIQDISTAFRMLDECRKNQQACSVRYYMLNWCTGMYLCSMLERTLGLIYEGQCTKMGRVHYNKPSLENLIRDEEGILQEIFTRNQLENYVLLLSYDKKGRRGLNYRRHISAFDYKLETMQMKMLAKLLYIYTDILNTILLYIIN